MSGNLETQVANDRESNGLNLCQTCRLGGRVEQDWGHLFIISSSSHFFSKIDLEQYLFVIDRGGVEATSLEAKAKDTKKFLGQGQGQTLSRPRTKDTDASVLKKRFSKTFFSNLKKKVFKKIFQAKKVFKNFFSGDFHMRKTKKGLRKFSERFLALSNQISTIQKIVRSSSRGQGNFRGLEASRPRPRPRTSKYVLEAKDILEDSTPGHWPFGYLLLRSQFQPTAVRNECLFSCFHSWKFFWKDCRKCLARLKNSSTLLGIGRNYR